MSEHCYLAGPKQRWKAQEKEALMDFNLTHDEDDGGGDDDDDFGQNRPRIAATLRAFLLHCRKSPGKQAATRDTEKHETLSLCFSINKNFIRIFRSKICVHSTSSGNAC